MADHTTGATDPAQDERLSEDMTIAMCHAMWLVTRLTDLRLRAGLAALDLDTPFLVPMPEGVDGALFQCGDIRATAANHAGGVSLDLPVDEGGELGRLRVGEPVNRSGARRFVMKDACHRTGDLLLEASAILLRDGRISDDTHQYNREAAYRAMAPFMQGAEIVIQDPTAAVVRGPSDQTA